MNDLVVPMYMVHVYTSIFIGSTGLCIVLCGYNLFMHGHITCHILPCYIHAIPTASFLMVVHKLIYERLGGTHAHGTCVHIDFYQLNRPVYGVVWIYPVYAWPYNMPHTTLFHTYHPHSLILDGHAENNL